MSQFLLWSATHVLIFLVTLDNHHQNVKHLTLRTTPASSYKDVQFLPLDSRPAVLNLVARLNTKNQLVSSSTYCRFCDTRWQQVQFLSFVNQARNFIFVTRWQQLRMTIYKRDSLEMESRQNTFLRAYTCKLLDRKGQDQGNKCHVVMASS